MMVVQKVCVAEFSAVVFKRFENCIFVGYSTHTCTCTYSLGQKKGSYGKVKLTELTAGQRDLVGTLKKVFQPLYLHVTNIDM